jgi:hypothetical protein
LLLDLSTGTNKVKWMAQYGFSAVIFQVLDGTRPGGPLLARTPSVILLVTEKQQAEKQARI